MSEATLAKGGKEGEAKASQKAMQRWKRGGGSRRSWEEAVLAVAAIPHPVGSRKKERRRTPSLAWGRRKGWGGGAPFLPALALRCRSIGRLSSRRARHLSRLFSVAPAGRPRFVVLPRRCAVLSLPLHRDGDMFRPFEALSNECDPTTPPKKRKKKKCSRVMTMWEERTQKKATATPCHKREV